MRPILTNPMRSVLSRRDMLAQCGMGFGAIGLTAMLGSQSSAVAASGFTNPLAPRQPPFRARAKRVIHFFLNGGPSHVDSFDPKPALEKYAGKPPPGGSPKT